MAVSLAQNSPAEKFFPTADLMPVGAYYYPEHWDKSQWERDIKRIAELGFSFTHFAEFAWANLEPEDGKFDFTWLDECVGYAQKHQLKVIMCTPTPCPPAWLCEKHPEILLTNADGVAQKHGSRLEADGTHPVYQYYIKRILEKLVTHYGNHPAIWGWQLDNEPHYSTMQNHSEWARQQFQSWLRKKYNNDIEALNKAWGANFWSNRYNNFEQINTPRSNTGAAGGTHAIVDFREFTAHQTAAALQFQSDFLRSKVNPKQWITTNYAYYKFLPEVDLFKNPKSVDFASHTMYLTSGWLNDSKDKVAHRTGSGMELAFSNAMARSIRGYTGIMEIQPGQINWGKYNPQPYPGAVRMWLWHSFAMGDKFLCNYRFRQPIYGGEQYHSGIMETDGITVARGGQEFVTFMKEQNEIKKKYNPKATEPAEYAGRRTAFLWKQRNMWDLDREKHSSFWETYQHYYTYFENLKTIGAPVDFLQETDAFDVKKYPYMVAPAYQMIDKNLVEKWRKYVQEGGNLILTCRTGQKDNNGWLWEARLQEPIWDLIGAKIQFNDQLAPDRKGNVKMDGKDYNWYIWAEVLALDKNIDKGNAPEVWATYENEFYAPAPAITHRKIGKGTVTYIGVWSDNWELERMTLRKLYQKTGATILDLPRYVFTEWRDGFWVTVNYTDTPFEVKLPEKAEILLGEKTVKTAGVLVWK